MMRTELELSFAIAEAFDWDGVWTTFLGNVVIAVALAAARQMGTRQLLLKRNASELALIRRLTRALELATDPFTTTYETRARLRVEFGL